jgi:hypothetical protein
MPIDDDDDDYGDNNNEADDKDMKFSWLYVLGEQFPELRRRAE